MKLRPILAAVLLAAALCEGAPALAQAQPETNLNVNTPASTALRASLKARHEALAPYLDSGAIGIATDGRLAVHDPAAVPLSERQKLQSLMSAENADWTALYREIANANGHPEWEAQVRDAFNKRRMERAPQRGWWVQGPNGWVKK